MHIDGLWSNVHHEPVGDMVEEWVLDIHICGHIGDYQVIDAA
jgi:Icc-related predicted phosphoesterase